MPRDAASRGPRWHARREVIVDTSARVFAERGYHGTGIADLCAANGLGKGALYHYIGSKEQLLAAIHDRVMDEVMAGADRVAAAGQPPAEQLAALGAELLDVIVRRPDHVWVFLHEFPALSGDRAKQFRVRRRAYEQRIEAVLRAGVDAGSFRADLDVRLTVLAWLGMHNYTYLWFKAEGPATAADLATVFADLVSVGVGAAGASGAPGTTPRKPKLTLRQRAASRAAR